MKNGLYVLILCSLIAVVCGNLLDVAANPPSHGRTQAQRVNGVDTPKGKVFVYNDEVQGNG